MHPSDLMDKKIAIIAAIAAIVIIAAAAFVILNNGSEDKKSITDVAVDNNGKLSDTTIQQGINGATGNDLAVTINNAASNSATVKINASGFKKIADSSKTLTLINGDKKATFSKEALRSLGAASGELNVDFKTLTDSSSITNVIGNAYTEARALASVSVKDSSGKALNAEKVTFSIPYKLDKKESETADKAVQWIGTSSSSKASYSNGVATISGKTNDNVCLAFMSPEDARYYPITYTTMIANVPVEQTVTHKPTKVVTVWDSALELALLFGLKDNVVFAWASDSYNCLNSSVQNDYNAIKKTTGAQSALAGYVENVRALEPEFILGWSSTFTANNQAVLATADEINNWGAVCQVCNRPSASLNDYYTIIENIGKVFNDKATADKLINDFKGATEKFQKKLADAGITEDKKHTAVILETGYGDDKTNAYTYGASFLTGDLITQAGGINLFTGAMEMKGAEDILNVCLPNGVDKIDTIILFDKNKGDFDKTVADFKATPAYATLGKSADIYSLSFAQLYMGGVMQSDILEVIFGMLYPELV